MSQGRTLATRFLVGVGHSTKDENIVSVISTLFEQEPLETAARKSAQLLNLLNDAIDLDAYAIKQDAKTDWESRKNTAVNLLNQVADLFDDPSDPSEGGFLFSQWIKAAPDERADFGISQNPNMSDPDDLKRCIELGFLPPMFRKIANAISEVPAETLRPWKPHRLFDADPSNVGTRGKPPPAGEKRRKVVADPTSVGPRDRGFLVRALNDIVPDSMEDRMALLQKLVSHRYKDISQQYVRSALLKGHT